MDGEPGGLQSRGSQRVGRDVHHAWKGVSLACRAHLCPCLHPLMSPTPAHGAAAGTSRD